MPHTLVEKRERAEKNTVRLESAERKHAMREMMQRYGEGGGVGRGGWIVCTEAKSKISVCRLQQTVLPRDVEKKPMMQKDCHYATH